MRNHFDNPDGGPEVRAFRTGREQALRDQEDGKLQDGSNNRAVMSFSTDRINWLSPISAIHGAQ